MTKYRYGTLSLGEKVVYIEECERFKQREFKERPEDLTNF